MKSLLLFLSVSLSCCAPYIDAKKGIVSTGFLSTVQGFSGKLKMPDGTTASWSVVGSDAATGPVNLSNSIGATIGTVAGFRSADNINASNNGVTNVAARQTTKQQGQSLKAANASKSIDAHPAQFNKGVDAGATPTVGTVQPIAP